MISDEIWFVLPKLQTGGIEKNTLSMMRQCRKWGLAVRLMLAEQKGELIDSVPNGIPIHCLANHCKIAFPFRLADMIKQSRPACIISAFDDINLMVVAAKVISRSTVPLVLSSHNTFSSERLSSSGFQRFKLEVIKRLLPWAFSCSQGVVVVSQGVGDDLAAETGFPRDAFDVIYNPVIEADFRSRIAERKPLYQKSKAIVFVGRLVTQKNVPTLIKAFAILAQRQDACLDIVGDGPERPAIERLIKELSLQSKIKMVGAVENPLPFMAGSDVLVLPSKFEGLGNVLIEAMGCGTQIVAADCPHGPSEILENGRWGQLVPVGDELALANALERSLDRTFWVDPDKLRNRAAEFSVEEATKRYLALAGYDVSGLPS